MIGECGSIGSGIWDICIVGSGPVGMAMALELDRRGRDVLVLESGGLQVEPQRTEDSRAMIQNGQTHAPMEIATCRALGGTSWTWGGRCVPFDDIDLVERPWVPYSGWPLSHSDLRPWYAKASEYLLCGSDNFEKSPLHLPPLLGDITANTLERWATESRIALIHRRRIEDARHITLCLNSTVIDLQRDTGGKRIENLLVSGANASTTIRARQVILALGGVETTRFLLAMQQKHPGLLGDAALGRFYMGHISGKIADILFASPDAVADFDFERDAGSFVRRRFLLSAAAQQEHQVLNTAFWPDNAPFYDYRHRSGVLSGVFLALSFPPTGHLLLPEGIRLAHIGSKPRHYGAHLLNLVAGAPAGARDIAGILRDRFLTKPRKPGFLVRNRAGKYALHYHGEQEPNPESRITLADERDRFGLPRAVIDFRFTEGDARSVVKSHQVLDAALRASGVGRLEYRYPEAELQDRVLAQAADGYHQAGTTRMGTNPRTSVVDPDLKVHGIENLYIASSSVFPTTGQANSTYPAVALGLRLVHHLSGRSKS